MFSVNTVPCFPYHFPFSSLPYCETTVYETCDLQNTCQSAVDVASKASSQQEAVGSYILGESSNTCIFDCAEGVGLPNPVLFEGQLYYGEVLLSKTWILKMLLSCCTSTVSSSNFLLSFNAPHILDPFYQFSKYPPFQMDTAPHPPWYAVLILFSELLSPLRLAFPWLLALRPRDEVKASSLNSPVAPPA